ncbi:YdcF family protein [Mycolicibacterium confluentis]|uniref:DUF218 domain-containing protein n=1 Tax=Mycolicibacterium confluentis TaxID=28047 RepID=A0A7I7XSI7_9MYCO|nr:YdcF family protein [Mycolicibacterium confluentis]MCV7318881.1 YdcF family protein [Mycolicibacterium confluentis]ORV23018.1 hypothetical protein AWB99_24095 [Mycolicibacterium confluentis]BBZ32033.1 hypothetical protein MCNF_06380 [Mycolicibacterium confluentis]
MRRLVALLLAAVVVVGVAGYPVFVSPQVDDVRAADAILVVGGDGPEARVRHGLDLARQGWARHVVLSSPGGQVAKYCSLDDPAFTVECFDPKPRSTLGEARELGRLAKERGWRTVIVVTYPPHISRARFIMDKCFDGELIMSAAPLDLSVPYWAWMYVYQSAGYAKAFLQSGC